MPIPNATARLTDPAAQRAASRADLMRIAKTEDEVAGDANDEYGDSDEPDPQRDVHDFSSGSQCGWYRRSLPLERAGAPGLIDRADDASAWGYSPPRPRLVGYVLAVSSCTTPSALLSPTC